jgi:hypothetical protein
MNGFLHLTPHILDGDRLWWPVSEFEIGLPRYPLMDHTRNANGEVVLLELDYSIAIKCLTDDTITFFKM